MFYESRELGMKRWWWSFHKFRMHFFNVVNLAVVGIHTACITTRQDKGGIQQI